MKNTNNRGFSLVELMVAVAIGLILLTAITGVFISNRAAQRIQQSMAKIQESGRFAIELISKDIRMAGYMGCGGVSINPVNTLLDTSNPVNFGVALIGYQGGSSSWTPSLTTTLSTLTPKLGTDVISISRVEGDVLGLTAKKNSASEPVQVDAPNSITEDDILLITDCAASSIFQQTGTNPGTSGILAHDVIGNSTTDLGHLYGSDAQVMKLANFTYYIDASQINNAINSLWRIQAGRTAQELVQGIDNIKITYGIDSDADKVPNKYITASNVTDWSQVVSVKISLLAYSIENNVTTSAQPYTFNGTATTPADKKLRSVFNAVINLRNRVP